MIASCPLAYIDPVSGTILLQLIIAGFIGSAVFFRRAMWRIIRLFVPAGRHEEEENSK